MITSAAIVFSTLAYSQVGINTTSPQKTLDIEGSLRLSQTPVVNIPTSLAGGNHVPLYGNKTDGSVQYAPNGYTKVVGGFRPGASSVIATFPATNTMARIRFICYIDGSSEANNSAFSAYTYGDFTIVGMGVANPVKIIDVQLKGYDGTIKTPLDNTGTVLSWANSTPSTISFLNTVITLNQSTGVMTLSGPGAFSYFFEILGGI
ncbi:hypothetical protein [Chryseobacterium sp. Mn2064]|uniref:hypothetical protein n=1 Tax=Chryseobacterium sp. Mn2064 TaxID=3395263 RepID=UPI003BED9F83